MTLEGGYSQNFFMTNSKNLLIFNMDFRAN